MASRSFLLNLQRADLLRYVGRRVRDPVLTEDIVQEAYLRLLMFEAQPGRVVMNTPAMLRRISLNLVRDHFRRAKRMHVVELVDTIPCLQPAIDQQIERKQLINLVAEILQAMPRLRREVFIRRRVHGETAGEVAKALGLQPSAVSNHVARAFCDLDEAIEKIEKRGISVRG